MMTHGIRETIFRYLARLGLALNRALREQPRMGTVTIMETSSPTSTTNFDCDVYADDPASKCDRSV